MTRKNSKSSSSKRSSSRKKVAPRISAKSPTESKDQSEKLYTLPENSSTTLPAVTTSSESSQNLLSELASVANLLTEDEIHELDHLHFCDQRFELEQSLSLFIREAWHTVEPEIIYKHNWHIEAICEYLTAVVAGKTLRVIINMPPRMMKSLIVSVFFPVWIWTTQPAKRFICTSYEEGLATDLNIKRRTVIQSDWYQKRWGKRYQLAGDLNLKTHFSNTKSGTMFCIGGAGNVTGHGADFIIVDDPHNPKKASSEADRKNVIGFYRTALCSRLNDPKTGAIIGIMQRVHQEDWTGWCLDNEPGVWTTLTLPMRAEGREVIEFPISKTEHVRTEGELLFPERFGEDEVRKLAVAMGSTTASGQLQQRPSPLEGGMIKRAWLKFYKELPGQFDQIIQSWDMAFKEAKDTDFVVGQVWGRAGANKYLLDQVRDRMDFPRTLASVRMLSAKWPTAHLKVIEDKANGPAVVDSLRHEISGLVAEPPSGSKAARVAAVSPDFEAGNVYLPEPSIAPWIHDYVEEICSFTADESAAHDDQVDATSQALNRLRMFPSGIASFYQEAAEAKQGVAA